MEKTFDWKDLKESTYPQIIPHLDLYDVKGKAVLVFKINKYPIKPVSYKNRYYKRVKNSNHMLSLYEIVDIQQQSLNISFDSYPLNENLSSLNQAQMEFP